MMMTKGRIMGLDVGDARVGVALTDPLGIIAQPLCTIERANGGLAHIVRLIKEKSPQRIVVGHPLELSGERGPQALRVEAFVEKLRKVLAKEENGTSESLKPEIIFWDERFSTQQAERVMVGSKLKNRDCHEALDRVSAAVILESYINSL